MAVAKISERVHVRRGEHAGRRGWAYSDPEPGLLSVVFDAVGESGPPVCADIAVGDLAATDLSRVELSDLIAEWTEAVDRRPVKPKPGAGGCFLQTIECIDRSVLDTLRLCRDVAAPEISQIDRARSWGVLRSASLHDDCCGAAVGALLGLAIGDSVGHPLEFIPVDEEVPCPGRPAPKKRPYLHDELQDKAGSLRLKYNAPLNKFSLRPGQWTDDASMSLCLADSLLVEREYNGADARVRWHQWWNHGYCNAFRFDKERRRRGATSIGLGGNIAKSIEDVDYALVARRGAGRVPAVYESDTEDAGNGSIMRLAPVAIALWREVAHGEEVAEMQSRATHPGADAAACCRFLSFFIAKAIEGARGRGSAVPDSKAITDRIVSDFVDTHETKGDTGMERLMRLLRCMPPSDTEACWNWRTATLNIQDSIVSRRSSEDGTYNGYPVLPGYWGAYCMDGLAMALWAVWHGGSFSDIIRRCVNLLGDADTTGAIAGQMAGAIHGFRGIIADDMGKTFLRNLRTWDPYAEVGLRAVLLFHQFAPEAQSPSAKRRRVGAQQ